MRIICELHLYLHVKNTFFVTTLSYILSTQYFFVTALKKENITNNQNTVLLLDSMLTGCRLVNLTLENYLQYEKYLF